MKTAKAQRDQVLSKVLGHFPTFQKLVWRTVGLPDPTPVQKDIGQFLSDDSINRKVIQGFRGVAKTWTTAAFVVWCLRRDRNVRILIVSQSKDKADEISSFCQQILSNVPGLSDLVPSNREESNWSRVKFTVKGAKPDVAPSVTSKGITSQITGCRADIIVADDVESPNNTATQEQREKLLRAVGEFGSILKEDKSNTPSQIIYLGTPHSEDSLYNHLRERGYATRIWPAQIPENPEAYHGCLGPIVEKMIEETQAKPGTPTEPSRFPLSVLENKAVMDYGGMNTAGYRLQFMLDTTLADLDKYPLKTKDLMIMALDGDKAPTSLAYANANNLVISELPNIGFSGDRLLRPLNISNEWTKYENTIAFVDPSGRGKDETTMAIVSGLHGWLFIREWSGWKGGYGEDTLKNIAKACETFNVKLCLIEPNFGDGMFAQLLKPIMRALSPKTGVQDGQRASTQKERRICDTLEPVLGRHRLVLNERVAQRDIKEACGAKLADGSTPLQYSGLYQLTHITRDKGSLRHDDRIDALAGAVAWWTNTMARNAQHAEQRFKDAQHERIVSEHLQWIKRSKGNSYSPKHPVNMAVDI